MHNKDFFWPVVPLCEKQLRDVRQEDILNNGLYRKCNTYRGGGGYDRFESIYRRRFSLNNDLNLKDQFVVQLKGCVLSCPYCYVTQEGVDGLPVHKSSSEIVADFRNTGLKVFHLMGGAPGLYLSYWDEILSQLSDDEVFHSDLLLLEGRYDLKILQELGAYSRQLIAVSIKGATEEEFSHNTGCLLNSALFWENFDVLLNSRIPFYLTYTGMGNDSIELFKQQVMDRYGNDADNILADSFAIQIIRYEALK